MRSILMLFLLSAVATGFALSGGCTSEQADAGPTEQTVFEVQGMTCDGCAGTVRTAIEKVPGVKSCDVSWEKNQAVVEADPSVAGPDAILAAIEETGYDVKLAGEASEEPPEPEAEGEPAEAAVEPPAG